LQEKSQTDTIFRWRETQTASPRKSLSKKLWLRICNQSQANDKPHSNGPHDDRNTTHPRLAKPPNVWKSGVKYEHHSLMRRKKAFARVLIFAAKRKRSGGFALCSRAFLFYIESLERLYSLVFAAKRMVKVMPL